MTMWPDSLCKANIPSAPAVNEWRGFQRQDFSAERTARNCCYAITNNIQSRTHQLPLSYVHIRPTGIKRKKKSLCKNYIHTHTHQSYDMHTPIHTSGLESVNEGRWGRGREWEVGYSSVLFATATLDNQGTSAGVPLLSSRLHIQGRCGKGMHLPHGTPAKGQNTAPLRFMPGQGSTRACSISWEEGTVKLSQATAHVP